MMTDNTRKSLKEMTEEERKEHRRKQNREYQAKRRQEPDYVQKLKDYNNARKKILRADEQYVMNEREYNKIYQRNKRKEYMNLQAEVKILREKLG